MKPPPEEVITNTRIDIRNRQPRPGQQSTGKPVDVRRTTQTTRITPQGPKDRTKPS